MQSIKLPAVAPIKITAAAHKSNIKRESVENPSVSHIHEECEIYVNLSGDVSFMVENTIYPIVPGSVIITRPYEEHHCIYHSTEPHKHFWVLFSCRGNEGLFSLFFNRKLGRDNLLLLQGDQAERLYSLCNRLSDEKFSSEAEKYLCFFELIFLLQNADAPKQTKSSLPDDICIALQYIGDNFTLPITVKEIATAAHVSVNTLERHFLAALDTTPSAFVRKKRFANAVKLLSQGATVADASSQSGFTDFSSFISLFKKNYGVTPLKYKKLITGKKEF